MKMNKFLEEVELTTKKYLAEVGLDYSKNKVGETKFTKTDGSEDYIQKIINDFANYKGISKSEAQKLFDDRVNALNENFKASLVLNETMMDNIAEKVAFDFLEQIPMEDVKFSKRIFMDLFQEVKSEVPEFYPLSNIFEPKRIEPTIWYSPDKLAPEYNSVKTAACSPDAKLIFNVPFMEQLIKFANIKGIKADPTKLHGKKYVSQGGNIPDEYLYAEFVLLHEIMHYGNGDFFFEKAYNLKGKLVNYVGDFVTNYNLVKSGYAQLPIGLFNDKINYDRYNSYQQMYDVVKAEMDKLSQEQQKNMKDQLDNMGDDMPDDGEGAEPNQKPSDGQSGDGQSGDGQSGDGQSGDGQSGDGQSGDGQSGDGQSGDGSEDQNSSNGSGSDGIGKPNDKPDDKGNGSGNGDDKPNDDKGKGSGSGSEKDDIKAQEERAKQKKQAEKEGKNRGKIPSSIDDAIKGNANKLNNAQNDTGRTTKTGMNPDALKPGDISSMMSGNNTGTGQNSADANPYDLGGKQYKPKLNWRAMLKKMVPSGTDKTETYSKPSRRTTSSMVSVAQTGSGVVKPGVKEVESDKKGLCFILDNSGSTMAKIGEMQNDIMSLLKKESKNLNGEMYVMKFSNDVHYFKVDVSKKKYARITDIADFIKTGKSSIKCDQPVSELFKSTYGGMTELTSKITLAAKTLFQKKFNVVLFSDSDISGGENAKQFKDIFISGKKQIAVIGCSKSDYESFVNLLGNKNNITYYS